jgi:threonine aldolase
MQGRLVEDHARARRLGAALAGREGIEVLPVRTNIVVARLARGGAPELAAGLAGRGVLVAAMDASTLRLVTHRDVDDAGCGAAIAALEAALEEGAR